MEFTCKELKVNPNGMIPVVRQLASVRFTVSRSQSRFSSAAIYHLSHITSRAHMKTTMRRTRMIDAVYQDTFCYQNKKEFKVGNCKGQKLVDGETIPLVLQPPEGPNNRNDMVSLLLALEKNKEWFRQMIIKNSAVLLRGFNVRNAEDFNDIVETIGCEYVHYVGLAPRTYIHKRIYTSSEWPLSETISFHHEMAVVPPPEGGETPIVPSFRVAERMAEEFPEAVKEMEEKGLKYTFTTPAQNTVSVKEGGWSKALGTSDPTEAAKRAKGLEDIDMEWLPDGSRKTVFAQRPLTKVFDGRKGRKMWFNIVYLMYANKLNPAMMMDGTEIPEKLVKRCGEILEEESIQFKWEKGDVLFLDNMVEGPLFLLEESSLLWETSFITTLYATPVPGGALQIGSLYLDVN